MSECAVCGRESSTTETVSGGGVNLSLDGTIVSGLGFFGYFCPEHDDHQTVDKALSGFSQVTTPEHEIVLIGARDIT